LEEYAQSAGRALYTAQYLWNDLHLRDAAIGALAAADGRNALRENGRWVLVGWLRHEQRWGEMLPHAERLVAARPDNLQYRVENVRALHGVGRDDDGRALVDASYEHFAALNAKRRVGWPNTSSLAQISLDCAYFARAARYFDEAIREYERITRGRVGAGGDGRLSNLYGTLARAQIGLGQFDEAVDSASSAVVVMGSRSDNRAQALAALRSVLSAMPDLDTWAARYDEQVSETGLDAPVIRRALAQTYLDRQQPEQALAQLTAALKHYPEDLELRTQVVRAAELSGDANGVVAALTASLFHIPAQPKLYGDLAEHMRKLGDEDGAERALTGLAEYAPNEAEGHRELARLLTEAARFDDAVVQWRQVVRIRTRELESWFGLARAQSAAGDREGALATLDELASLSWAGEHRQAIAKARKQLRAD
jgi:tetratricopeptide (TPR) repeat protein